MQQAPWIAKNFLTNGRPLFNEKAYKILVNQGHGDRARRLYYNKPRERAEDDDQGPGRQRAGLRRRLQRGVRRLDRWLRCDVGTPDPTRRQASPCRAGRAGPAPPCRLRPAGPVRAASSPRSSSSGRSSSSRSGSSSVTASGQVVDYNVVHDWTLDNYRYFFSVGTYVRTLWATIWVSVAATALTIAIAFPFAYWLVRYVPRRLQRSLLVLVILPFWTSYLLRVYSWLNILGEQGAINRLLAVDGHHRPPALALPLRPPCGDPRARVPLLPVRGADAVRVARALRLGPVQGGDGPRRQALSPRCGGSCCRRSSRGSRPA